MVAQSRCLQELAEAEAQADLAALAASQRATSLGKQSLEEGPSEEDASAPFTEEALSAVSTYSALSLPVWQQWTANYLVIMCEITSRSAGIGT